MIRSRREISLKHHYIVLYDLIHTSGMPFRTLYRRCLRVQDSNGIIAARIDTIG